MGSVASANDFHVKLRDSLESESLLDGEDEVTEEYDSLLLSVILDERALESGQADVVALCLSPQLFHYLLEDLIAALCRFKLACITYWGKVA